MATEKIERERLLALECESLALKLADERAKTRALEAEVKKFTEAQEYDARRAADSAGYTRSIICDRIAHIEMDAEIRRLLALVLGRTQGEYGYGDSLWKAIEKVEEANKVLQELKPLIQNEGARRHVLLGRDPYPGLSRADTLEFIEKTREILDKLEADEKTKTETEPCAES